MGSRNIGATNAYRVLGARWGLLVFGLDAAKGFFATMVPALLATAWWTLLFPRTAPDPQSLEGLAAALRTVFAASLASGVAAILGHVFSPWVGFKGGRGVATSLGVFLSIVPGTLLAFLVWILLVVVSRRVSVGSIGAALAYPFIAFFMLQGNQHRTILTITAAAISLLVIVRHKANIQRLLAGTEPPLGRGGTPGPATPSHPGDAT